MKNKTLKKSFVKELISILPFVFLIVISINIFIFYFFQTKEGIIFLYDLFLDSGNYVLSNGNFIYYSNAIVVILLLYPLLKLSELDTRTKTFFGVYAFINGILLSGTSSVIYVSLSTGKLPWQGYFIIEILYELAAIYIIYIAIKNKTPTPPNSTTS